jgi:DNA polymerase-3 subunit beta
MKANSVVDSLALLDKVIPGRPLDPIMGNIEFSPDAEGLAARAVSASVDLSLRLERVEVYDSGEPEPFLIPTTVLTKLTRSLGDAEATLAFDGEGLSIVAGSFQTRLRAIKAKLPARPEGDPRDTAEEVLVLGRNLAQAIQRVVHAAATEDYRGALTGIELGQSGGDLWAVATDGFRLAVQHVPQVRTADFKVLIPAESVGVLLKFLALSGPDEIAGLYPGRNGVRLELAAGSIWLAAREGMLPEWRRVIPDTPQQTLTVEALALKKALERALILSDPETCRVDVCPSGNYIVVSTETGTAKGSEPVPASGPAAPGFSINGKYLRAALTPIDGPVTLGLSGPLAPIRIEAVDDPGYTAVVVPLRV